MELIEKEAVLNEIGELFTICSETLPNENGSHYVTESELITHKRIIMELPTIDAVPVVRCEDCKNCLDCDLHQIVYGDSYADTDVYCFKEKRCVGARFGPTKDLARPDWCPIICQLPEGHGRLVDADACASVLRKLENEAKTNSEKLCFGYAAKMFEEAFTIVPAEAERSET